MNSPSKELIKHSIIYGSGDILQRMLAFFLLPVYTRFLSPEEYGVLQLLVITSSLILVIVQLGLGSAIFKSILYNKEADKKTIISTSFYFLTATSFFILAVLFFNSGLLSKIILNSLDYSGFFKIILLSIFFNTISVIPLAYLRIEDASLKFSILIFCKFTLQLLLNIFFVIILKKGIAGVIIAELLASFSFSVVLVGLLFKNLRLVFSKNELKDMLGFGLPLAPAGLAMFVLTMSDRYFLNYFVSLDQVGIYSVGYRVGMVIAVLVGAFQKAWPSVMFNIAKIDRAKEVFAKNFIYFMFVLLFFSLGLSLFAKEILSLIVTPTFTGAYRIIPLIAVAFLCYGVYFYTAIGMNLKKKTYYQPIIVGISAIINLVLNYLLIPVWGVAGAAFSTAFCFIIMAVMANVVSQHFYYIPYQYRKIAIIILIAIGLWAVSNIQMSENIMLSSFFKLLLWVGYPLFVWKLGVFSQDEKKKIKHSFGKLISGSRLTQTIKQYGNNR